MAELGDALGRKVPTDDEAHAWAKQLTDGLVHGTMHWKKFSKREWFLEGKCPRCTHDISIPIGVLETIDVAVRPPAPPVDDATTVFVAANHLHWDFAFLACNCREGHKFTPADEKPTPGCGFAEQHTVVLPVPDLGA